MDYKDIIYKVAKSFDPDLDIEVAIVNDTDMGEAHFVVADIKYKDDQTMRVPFVIYDESSIFMPQDWQSGELPYSADKIEDTKWVTYPNVHDAVILNGLPRLFAGDF